MKAIKFWAETKDEANKFFNYVKACGGESEFDWAETLTHPRGYYMNEVGRVTQGPNIEFFKKHASEEFFFPMPVEVSEKDSPVVSDGKSTSYYQLTITNKDGESIKCEMGDVIRCVVGDNFALGNIYKAARRMYEASQGRGKKDVSISYDANKIGYFAQDFADAYDKKESK